MTTDYATLNERLTGRCKLRRKVANNTYAERRGDSIALKLHDTDVVTYHPDGSITLDTGGWFTVTTKDRMNNAIPHGTWEPDYCALGDGCPGEYVDGHYHGHHVGLRGFVGSSRGEWFVTWGITDNLNTYVYRDGITLHPDGTVTGAPTESEIDKQRKRVANANKLIKRYLATITPDKILHAWEHAAGDPWCCSMRADDGTRPMGENCIEGHVRGMSFHASLAFRAFENAHRGSPAHVMQMVYADAKYGRVSDVLTRDLRRLLKKHLIEGVATR